MNKYRLIKSTAIFLIGIMLATTFLGCSQQKSTEKAATTAGTGTTSAIAESTAVSEEEASSTTSSAVTASNVTTAQTATAGISVSIGTTGSKDETAPAVSGSSAKTSTMDKRSETNKNTTVSKSNSTKKSTAVSSSSATPPAGTCRLDVECTAILSNKDDLKPGHSNYVPKDGYIIKNYLYKIKSPKDNVYDVLKKACSDNGVKLTAERTSMGTYISGIGNIDEKDCGSMSGWKYKVNGNYPAFNVEKYTVSEGDSIVFTYVLKP